MTARPWKVRKLGLGRGQVAGESHPHAKMTEGDVVLARLIAADRAQPRGWISDMAAVLGVTDVAIVMAIGGATWRCIDDPPPVPARQRHARHSLQTRPRCPTCDHATYYPVLDGRPCRDRFHSIDHRKIRLTRTPALVLRRTTTL